MTFVDPKERRRLLRSYHRFRLAGLLVVVLGLGALIGTEGRALWPAVAAMVAGAVVACAGVLRLARLETLRDGRTRRATRLLVAGFGLKLFAIPLVAVGGGWLAWGGAPDVVLAVMLVGVGMAAYVYGIYARINGVSMLPSGATYA